MALLCMARTFRSLTFVRSGAAPSLGRVEQASNGPLFFCFALPFSPAFLRQVGASDGWAPAPRLTLAYPALLGACLIDPALLLASHLSFHPRSPLPPSPFPLRPPAAGLLTLCEWPGTYVPCLVPKVVVYMAY